MTEDERAAAAELYRSGLSLNQVADKLGCHNSAVYRAIVKAGVPRRGCGTGQVDPATKAAAVKRYVAGESSLALSRAFGVTPQSVINWVRNAGERVRGKRERPLTPTCTPVRG